MSDMSFKNTLYGYNILFHDVNGIGQQAEPIQSPLPYKL
jgi:hypothetical protein